MPSLIGHSVAGLAISSLYPSRPYKPKIGFLCLVCSVLPDLDAIGVHLGIPYQHWLGHRGFFHGIVFAVCLALIASLFFSDIEKSFKRRSLLFGTFLLCALLHGVLDAMTNGGLGVAFFSPFGNHRYFFPWRPIEVSSLSPGRFLNIKGLRVMKSEFVWVIIPSLVVTIVSFGGEKLYRRYTSLKIDRKT